MAFETSKNQKKEKKEKKFEWSNIDLLRNKYDTENPAHTYFDPNFMSIFYTLQWKKSDKITILTKSWQIW